MKTNTDTRPPSFTVDPIHTSIGFRVRHLMITHVRGEFQKVSGTVRFDPARREATEIEASIPVDSVSTRDAQRDAHLKSADFFDAAAHPTMTFRSTSARVTGPETLDVTGALQIRGVTREVTLALSEIVEGRRDLQGKTRLGASATATIKRSDFGMTFNRALETGGIAIADEIALNFDVSLLKDEQA